jgi:hypothetical protein
MYISSYSLLGQVATIPKKKVSEYPFLDICIFSDNSPVFLSAFAKEKPQAGMITFRRIFDSIRLGYYGNEI